MEIHFTAAPCRNGVAPTHCRRGKLPVIFILVGRVPERPKGTDCKSVGLCLRRFESCRAHNGHMHAIIYTSKALYHNPSKSLRHAKIVVRRQAGRFGGGPPPPAEVTKGDSATWGAIYFGCRRSLVATATRAGLTVAGPVCGDLWRALVRPDEHVLGGLCAHIPMAKSPKRATRQSPARSLAGRAVTHATFR